MLRICMSFKCKSQQLTRYDFLHFPGSQVQYFVISDANGLFKFFISLITSSTTTKNIRIHLVQQNGPQAKDKF